MAFQEYYDLYLLAQLNPEAPYYVVSFDTIGSRLLPRDKRERLTYNMIFIMKYVYGKLLEKEQELGRDVVIKDERFKTPWDPLAHDMRDCNYKDPSILGDNFEFTVLRDTVTKEEIIEWVNECREKLNMEEEFHIADGYYETNNYGEGGTKLWRGYCLQILEKFHKEEVQKELKQVRKKLIRKQLLPDDKKTSTNKGDK